MDTIKPKYNQHNKKSAIRHLITKSVLVVSIWTTAENSHSHGEVATTPQK